MHKVNTKQDAITLLRAHGVSPTSQRVRIAQLLFAKPQHLNADQIQTLVNQGEARISKATVYNSLAAFVRVGLLREIFADPSKIFYDSNLSDHHHLFNADTGELSDIDLGLGHFEPPAMAGLPAGVVVERVDVVVQVRNAKA